MRRLSIFLLVTGIVCLRSSDAEAGVFSQAKTYDTGTTVLRWMPLSGKFIAVTGAGVVFEDKTIATGQPDMIRILNDNFFGLLSHNGGSIGFRWFDENGVQIGRLEERWPGEIALPRFMIDPADRHLISADILNRLRIYDQDGGIVRESQIFPEYRYHDENIMYTIFNSGDRFILAGLTQVYPNPHGSPQILTVRPGLICTLMAGRSMPWKAGLMAACTHFPFTGTIRPGTASCSRV